MLVAFLPQVRRHFLAVGNDDRHQLGGEQPRDRGLESILRQRTQVRGLRRADELDAERMDEIHVPDLPDGRFQRSFPGQDARPALTTRDPLEPETLLVVLDHALEAHLPHGTVFVHRGAAVQVENKRWMPVASVAVATWSRKVFSLNI